MDAANVHEVVTMQAAVFSYGPSTLSLDLPATLTLLSETGPCPAQLLAAGKHPLVRGIYRVSSATALTLGASFHCDIYSFEAGYPVLPSPARMFGRFAAAFPEVSHRWLCEAFEASPLDSLGAGKLARFAIVAYGPATVTVDRELTLSAFPLASAADRKVGPGKVALAPGLYRVIAPATTAIAADEHTDVLITINTKTDVPDIVSLLGRFAAVFPYLSQADVSSYFPAIARNVELRWLQPTTLVGVAPAPR